MPSVVLAVLIALVVAVIAAIIAKRVPIVMTIGNLALMIFLIVTWFANFNVQQPAQWVSSVPFFGYLLAIPAGVLLGDLLKRYLPF